MNIQITDHAESDTCMGCDKPDKECLVIVTEGYTGPHCVRCVMREAKKRKKVKDGLFDSGGK